MTTEDHGTAVEYTPGATVTTSWYCGPEPEREIRYVAAQRPWWNRFSVGWVAGLLFCVGLDWIFS